MRRRQSQNLDGQGDGQGEEGEVALNRVMKQAFSHRCAVSIIHSTIYMSISICCTCLQKGEVYGVWELIYGKLTIVSTN